MSSTVKITLLLFSLLYLVRSAVLLPARDNNFIQQEQSCQSICELCDCQGFYCGEECICECALKEPENLQCIADMKKDCDEAGLEYELLLQGPQPRILRDLNEYYSNNGEKPDHIILLKQKRQSNSTVTVPTEDPIVGNTQNTEATTVATTTSAKPKKNPFDFILGNPQAAPALPNIQKIMLVLRERMAARRHTAAPKATTAPPAPTHAPLRTHAPIVAPRIIYPALPKIVMPTLAPPRPAPRPAAPGLIREFTINRKVSLPTQPKN